MLPATLQFLIVMIASSINERMQKRLDYKTEEVLVSRKSFEHTLAKPASISMTTSGAPGNDQDDLASLRDAVNVGLGIDACRSRQLAHQAHLRQR